MRALALALAVCGSHTSTLRGQPASAPTEDRPAALRYSRDLITERNNTPRARRGEAERLLKYRWPEAIDLTIELLQSPDASTRIAVCDALAAAGAADPSLLDARLVEPLIALLADVDAAIAGKSAAALSGFRDGGVPARLGALALNRNRPLPQRLFAVDALSANLEDRRVVEQLIALLDVPEDELRSRVLSALAPAAGDFAQVPERDRGSSDLTRDVNRWKQWWQSVAALDEHAWRDDRLKLLSQRNRALQAELARLRGDADQKAVALTKRLEESLRENYRLIGDAQQRQETLLVWLRDPAVEVRLIAMTIISGQIQDGTPPADAIRTELKTHVADDAPEARRRAMQIVGALNDSADAEAVLNRLTTEKDLSVREVALRVLGQLPHARSLPVLIAEIKNPEASTACVAEAARSLGLLPGKSGIESTTVAAAVEPLKSRYAATAAAETRLREALLRAMAQIGDRTCAEEFAAGLDSADPELLAAAILGVKAIADATQLPRVMTLTEHPDLRVRQRAIEALASLGGESVHLDRLVSRLNPSVEPNDACRQTAWTGFRQLIRSKPLALRLEWAERLKTLPELQREYLEELTGELAAQHPPRPELRVLRRRLAELYVAQGQFAEALPHWMALYKALSAEDDSEAGPVGQSALAAALGARRNDAVVEIVTQMLASGDGAEAGAIVAALDDSLRTLSAAGDHAATEGLRSALRTLPPEKCPSGLLALLGGPLPAGPASRPAPGVPR